MNNIKFIVVADARTGEDLALYFNPQLPDMHRELLNEARKIWGKLGIEVRCHGGGRFSVKQDVVAFYGKSLDYGIFQEDVVLRLAAEHTAFAAKNYRFFAKAGAGSPHEIPGVNLRF